MSVYAYIYYTRGVYRINNKCECTVIGKECEDVQRFSLV